MFPLRDPEVFVRSRSWFALTAVAAASFAGSAGIAVAATSKSTAAAKPIKLNCKVELIAAAPEGTNVVDQPPTQGAQYGPVNCHPFGPTGFGGGIVATSFTVPDSGDTVGKYTEYFKAGSVRGSFDLAPQEQDFSATNFASQTWQGTIKVLGGTGIYQGIKGKKAGTVTCTSTDSVHLHCVEKVKLKSL
jgi:hypothetical protein